MEREIYRRVRRSIVGSYLFISIYKLHREMESNMISVDYNLQDLKKGCFQMESELTSHADKLAPAAGREDHREPEISCKQDVETETKERFRCSEYVVRSAL
jgi:hypothetical protein